MSSGEYIGGMTAEEAYASTSGYDKHEVDLQESLDRHQAQSFANTAEHLAKRNSVSPEDVGAADSEVELRLQETLSQLRAHETGQANLDPLKVLQLQAQAERLAAAAVGQEYRPQTQEQFNTEVEERESFEEYARNRYPNLDEELTNAGKVLSQQSAENLNELLRSDDDEVKSLTMNLVHQLKETPQYFASSHTPLTTENANNLVAEFGEDLGGEIITLSAAVANGVVTPAQALATASKSPRLVQGLITAAQRGLIRIAL